MRCGREFNDWSLHLKGSPAFRNAVCQKCRAATTRGERRPLAKFTDYDVIEIRRDRTAGATIRGLASKHRVDESTISNIVNRKSWKHVA